MSDFNLATEDATQDDATAKAGMGSHERPISGEKDEWLTPPEIIQALGPFDLDPCSPIVRPWPTAAQHFTIQDNGLRQEWKGKVWCNPPYGSETGKWLGRMAEHEDGIALIFARTETEAWFRHIWGVASRILFLRGRITFYNVDGTPGPGNAGAPSALVAYGSDCARRLDSCSIPGRIIIP